MLKIKKSGTTDLSNLKKELDPIIRTTISIEKSIFQKFKRKALNEEKTMTALLRGWIEEYIK